ncbi:MAG: hypothetical protein JOY72_13025 [Actinobacteria bacterium]|nr:hypothetical protein [Actinomycetota bacterium]MBV8481214.1 hypothetical protein [Actinomycetota bacterium]
MRVVASDSAVDLIEERGGRLYVWLKASRCCHPTESLVASEQPKPDTTFRQVPSERFELYVPEGLSRLPDELHVEARRFPRRVEAYWDGCVWVV